MHVRLKCFLYVLLNSRLYFNIFIQGRNHASKVGGSESGEARIQGAKRPRFEGETRIEGEARERAGKGSGEGTR